MLHRPLVIDQIPDGASATNGVFGVVIETIVVSVELHRLLVERHDGLGDNLLDLLSLSPW